MFAQIMTAIGQPFVLNSFTKVSINWFPENEKTTATGLGTISILLGVVVGMIATPYLYEKQGIDFILWLYGILSLIAMVLYLFIVQNNPKSPPSAAAGTKVFDFKGMMKLFKVRDFNILLILVFIGLGSFNALLSDIDNIFIRFNINTQAAGLIAATMIFGGILGAGILSTYSDKLHKRKIFLVVAMLASIPLTVLLDITANLNQTLLISFIFGFFLVSALPISLIYAAEITYPITEEASNGLMMTLGQLAGIIFLISFNMYVLTILFLIGFALSLIMTDVTIDEANIEKK